MKVFLKLFFHSFCALVAGLFGSCCPQRNWIYKEVDSDCSQFNSAFLQHVPSSNLGTIEVQFLRTQCGVQGTLNIYCGAIQPLNGDYDQAIVVIEIEGERRAYIGKRMEGGQCVLLPDDATERLLHTLSCGIDVILYMEGFQTTLKAGNFPKKYADFIAVPIQTPQ